MDWSWCSRMCHGLLDGSNLPAWSVEHFPWWEVSSSGSILLYKFKLWQRLTSSLPSTPLELRFNSADNFAAWRWWQHLLRPQAHAKVTIALGHVGIPLSPLCHDTELHLGFTNCLPHCSQLSCRPPFLCSAFRCYCNILSQTFARLSQSAGPQGCFIPCNASSQIRTLCCLGYLDGP